MSVTPDDLKNLIRVVPDFPKPGISFKDISPLLQNGRAFRACIEMLGELVQGENVQAIAAPEARGFLFGATLAMHMGCGFVPIRKPNKLPHETVSHTYELEYGTDTVEMHKDGINAGDRILLVDDVLATGGTMAACAQLVESRGGVILGCAFFLELGFLNGRDRLKDYRIEALIKE